MKEVSNMEKESCQNFSGNEGTALAGKKGNRVKVLFLTNNGNALPLYEWICERADADLYGEPLRLEDIQRFSPDIVISYNYSHIIKQEIIDYMHGNIINMHVSYLPWNRGSSPNLWSFLDDTPKGVTIHKIDRNLDKGKILFQKRLEFDPAVETLETSYKKLNEEIVALFKSHWEDLINQSYVEYEPKEKGSYHSQADLKELQSMISFSWSDTVQDVVAAYKERVAKSV